MSVKLLGIKIDDFSFSGAITRAIELLGESKVSQIITINPEMIAYSEKSEEFKKILDASEMVIPDGVGIEIGLKLKGYSVHRIPGIDFAYQLLKECATRKIQVGIVGAKEEVVTKAISELVKQIEGLNIVYYHNGYFTDDNSIYDEIRNAQPRLILVAMGSPRQEEFIYNAKNVLHPALMIGIGGSLDVWSGNLKRAPKIYQKLGLEWLYRTITQPERLKRIFPALPLFLIKVLKYNKD